MEEVNEIQVQAIEEWVEGQPWADYFAELADLGTEGIHAEALRIREE